MASSTIYNQVIVRAVKDGEFRQRLVADPKKVLADEYNMQLPEAVKVRILETTADTFSLILPTPQEAIQELTDDELETAAGGRLSPFPTLICSLLLCPGSY